MGTKNKPFLSQVKWKGDHKISPPRSLRHLIRYHPCSLYLLYFFEWVKKIHFRFCSVSCNRSFPSPITILVQKVWVFWSCFLFRDNENCYFRFRLKTCSGSFTSHGCLPYPKDLQKKIVLMSAAPMRRWAVIFLPGHRVNTSDASNIKLFDIIYISNILIIRKREVRSLVG